MADVHVISTGSNTSPYDTWAKAATTIATGAAVLAAGDRLLIDSAHSETPTTSSITFPGTVASPNHIISVTHSGASGLDAKSAGATITVSASGGLGWTGSVYIYGLTFIQTAVTTTLMNFGNASGANQVLDTCTFRVSGGASASSVGFGYESAGNSHMQVYNCSFKFSHTGNRITVNGTVLGKGGQLESGGTSPTGLFNFANGTRSTRMIWSGFNLVNATAGINLIQTYGANAEAELRNWKLPASWSGTFSASPSTGAVARMINCDSGDTNYKFTEQSSRGTMSQETVIVRTGGATDGTTTIAWKMVSTANCSYVCPMISTELLYRQETVGSGVTATIEIIHDSLTALTDKEVWIELEYLGTSGFPLASVIDDAADVEATAAAQTSSSETWTTTGITNVNKQKLVTASFTPQEKGWFIARVMLAKPSYTIYVDPKLTVA